MKDRTLPKSYSPQDSEPKVQEKWDAARAFHADPSAPGEPYCILIPPPNVTAALHLGHALNNTLQDVLIRAHRMGIGGKRYNVLWMPGTDHAGISTQTVVEKRLLQEEGKKRTDYSREAFIAKVQAWKDEYEATITEQLKAMGCSCDWERQRFTMDEVCARAVREAFFRLFKDGLIYRGKRLVNWDPVTQTALADDEVEMEEVDGHFWYLRHPLVHPPQNPDDPLDCQEVTWSELAVRGYPGAQSHPDEEVAWVTVATTRPETYLGDTAVAVNPDDPRAAALRGLWVQLPIVGRVMPIIEDDYVALPDPEAKDPKAKYATGFLKVTPAHDFNDYEIGRRHAEEIERNTSGKVLVNVLAPDATISDRHGWEDVGDAQLFVGLSREEAREKIVREFEARGLLEASKPYRHSIGHSYRSHAPIEPYLSDQWYVKVTDDRLVGEAQRALADDQFEGEKTPRTGGAGASEGGAGVPPARPKGVGDKLTIHQRSRMPHWQLGGSVYHINFQLNDPADEMTDDEKQIVLDACAHWHGDRLHLFTATVMPNHVHMLIQPLKRKDDKNLLWSLPDLIQSIKGFSSHAIQKRRGSKGMFWQSDYFDRIIRSEADFLEKWNYIYENPVRAGLVARAEDYPFTIRPELSEDEPSIQLAGEDARSPRSARAPRADGDGTLKFFPARYAKTYQAWHDNLRDWCISRQLWWGHRIPVWTKPRIGPEVHGSLDLGLNIGKWQNEDRIAINFPSLEKALDVEWQPDIQQFSICVKSDGDHEVIKGLESEGFTQDPDVLDTWFSSGLWPLSTMGWPEPDAYPDEFPGGRDLLETFNPSSVLCTAREIITLWVSRMVMFNRYFTEDHRLPYRHVSIHPMIQDGHGQKMSKSLGNGVDPRDIIHTHGADAMRFILCQIATSTQDVRMPVDMICPHCAHPFHPQEISTPAGHRVAAPEQSCPNCGKRMASTYGVTSGAAKPTKDRPPAVNTSTRFDLGRNFCNKLWNAVRFALANLSAGSNAGAKARGLQSAGVDRTPIEELSLCDRWIIARLHRALHRIEDAVAEYQFNVYAETMYDFIWRDFCDWYLEAIKPTVRDNAAQQQVLRTVLNAALRLLHPICPFVTETLWPSVRRTGPAGLEGIVLEDSELLAVARWPDIRCSVDDHAAHDQFQRVQVLVEAIRARRGDHQVDPRRKITLFATPGVVELINEASSVVESLGGLEAVRPLADRSADAVPLVFEGEELALGGLVEQIDPEKERARLAREIEGLRNRIATHEKRLATNGYIQKAPAEKVQETRDELRRMQEELAAKEKALYQLADA